MKHRSILWAIALLPALAGAQDASYRQTRPVSECLDPARIRSWQMLDSDELLVDAGRRRFHLLFRHACGELNLNNDVVFRAGGGIGRLCGNPGDAVLGPRPGWRGSACAITQVTPLDKAQYDALLDAAERRRAGEPMPARLLPPSAD